jgi:hypothetical protein
MLNLYRIDTAVILYSIVLQLVFSFVTFFISYLSYKIFRITKNEQAKAMSLAFLFIFISYVVQAVFDFLIYLKVSHDSYVFLGIHPLSVLNEQGLYLHTVFFALGFSMLMYNAFRSDKKSLLWYFILSSLIILFISKTLMSGFFTLASLYLGFLAYHFFLNYNEKKTRASLVVAVAFTFLFIGKLAYLLFKPSALIFILDQTLDLLGYSLLISNYYLLRQDGKKKR